MISLNGVELNQWLPSWWGDVGGRLGTSLAKKPQLRKPLCIGRQQENARGAALRSHGGGRWRRKSRRWGRPGKASSLWQGTDRCGGNILLPYMPLRRKGHEWVSEWLCYSHQACYRLYYLCQINSGVNIYQFTFELLHYCFRMWFWFQIWTKKLEDGRTWRKIRHWSADLHTPIHPHRTWSSLIE